MGTPMRISRWSNEGDMPKQSYRPILCAASVLVAVLVLVASGGLAAGKQALCAIGERRVGNVHNPVYRRHDLFSQFKTAKFNLDDSDLWSSELPDQRFFLLCLLW
jgi:hypothetical protein